MLSAFIVASEPVWIRLFIQVIVTVPPFVASKFLDKGIVPDFILEDWGHLPDVVKRANKTKRVNAHLRDILVEFRDSLRYFPNADAVLKNRLPETAVEGLCLEIADGNACHCSAPLKTRITTTRII